MADFQAHVNQAKKNILILSEVNAKIKNSWDWQVTTSYYVAVHLINAHLAKSADLHYASHEKVKNALFHKMSPAVIDENTYLLYVKLENLSRRARYLCNDDFKKQNDFKVAFFTHDKHLKKALVKLNSLMEYFANKYDIIFDSTSIDCIELRSASLKYFKYVDNK